MTGLRIMVGELRESQVYLLSITDIKSQTEIDYDRANKVTVAYCRH